MPVQSLMGFGIATSSEEAGVSVEGALNAIRSARIGKALSISRHELAAYFAARGGGQLFADDAQE